MLNDDALRSLGENCSGMNEWWTSERKRLYEWLKKSAAQLAPVYLGGLRMAMDRSFPGRVHFVGHAIREIGNRLPEAIAGTIEGPNTEYARLARSVESQWVDAGLPSDGSPLPAERGKVAAPSEEKHTIPGALLRAVSELVVGHQAASSRNKQRARHLFEFYSRGEPIPEYAVKNWSKAIKQHGLAHVHDKPLRPGDEEEITEAFLTIEQVLLTFANRSYENMDELDGLLESANQR